MTAIVSLHLVKELKLDLKKTYFKVDAKASKTTGTTANVQVGSRITIFDLLHGLMLPSGNDAAMTLGENFGELLVLSKRPGK